MKFRNRLFATSLAAACLGAGLFAATAQAAAPAWQPIGATGPTVIPAEQSEVQKLFVDAEGGEFTLTARHLAAEGIGDVPSRNSSLMQNVIATSGAFASGQRLEGLGISPKTNVNLALGSSIFLSQNGDLEGAQVPIASYDSPATTPLIKHDAIAAEVQKALEELPLIGAGNVEVSGGPGGPGASHPYVITFKGTLKDTNVGLLEPGTGSLGGNAVTKTTTAGGRGTAKIALYAQNVGGAPSSGTITYRAKLPDGIKKIGPAISAKNTSVSAWSCPSSPADEIVCTREEVARPGLTIPPIDAVIAPEPGVTEGTVELEVSGGGASNAGAAELPLTVSTTPAEPGFQTFVAGAYDKNGQFDQRAGGHPFTASTAIFVNTVVSPKGFVLPAGEFKDITVKLPPGFLGNPSAVPACPERSPTQDCDLDSMVGTVEVLTETFGGWSLPTSVFNTQAPIGYPGKFRFRVLESEDVNVLGLLRSDEDYGIDAASLRTPQVDQVLGVFFTFWGEPASSAFNSLRCKAPNAGLEGIGSIRFENGCRPSTAPGTALLTSAVNCAEQATSPPTVPITTTIWQRPGQLFEKTFDIPPVMGCQNLTFEGGLSFQPSGTAADSPASFTTSLTMPDKGLIQPDQLMTPELKDSVVTLPEGVVLNASAADGLGACSLSQIGYKGSSFPMPNPMRFDKNPQSCPEASKIGTLDLKSALLEDPLHGALYLAAQGDGNPFGSLFAVYLVIEDPRHGIFIKLPGRVDPDPQNGQMKVRFTNLPQLPFTSLDLKLKGGDRSPLATPETCGTYTTTTTFTPWSYPESGPPTVSESSFEINQGPNGGACAKTPQERPFSLGWNAGAEKTEAGGSGPFDFQVTRPDGSQELENIELQTPEGVSASLKGIPSCTEAQIKQAEASTGKQEQQHPACPAASQVGTLTTGAGSGSSPFYVPGKLYLAGPYKGAPISVVAITPAVAGPFDLGDVVVRSAVNVNPETAQISAKSDPIPQILDGVVLRVRDVRIHLDHSNWTINPTSCDPMSVKLAAHGNSGASAGRSTRFQVGGCPKLGFKPKLQIKLNGGTKRNKYPALVAALTQPASQANIRFAQVALPHSEFLEQGHIGTVCTRVQFAANQCPAASVYGHAEAVTPLLDQPLSGPVYLRSSSNKLPDLVAALRGPASQPVEIDLDGRVDSVHGGIRTTFEVVPDAPVSKFVLRMQGGKKGLLVNSTNICRGAHRATVRMIGHNNKVSKQSPKIKARCRKQTKQRRHHSHHAGKGAAKRTLAAWVRLPF
jgi:hypothetical protein